MIVSRENHAAVLCYILLIPYCGFGFSFPAFSPAAEPINLYGPVCSCPPVPFFVLPWESLQTPRGPRGERRYIDHAAGE